MSRFGGLSEERPSVFKTRIKLGTYLSTQCNGDERQSRPLPSQLIESQTCASRRTPYEGSNEISENDDDYNKRFIQLKGEFREAASPLVRLGEWKERWVASDQPHGVLPQNSGETELTRSVTCMVLKATANDRRHLALS
ncbi:hypothetical protein TNCV_3363491 [Trichonephila clavipes]|nr:hypothetical protein TNCV_3363491 [Trichonephila clavipes]